MKYRIYASNELPVEQPGGNLHVIFRPVGYAESIIGLDEESEARRIADEAAAKFGPQILVRQLAEEESIPAVSAAAKFEYEVLVLRDGDMGFDRLGAVRAKSFAVAEMAAKRHWGRDDVTLIELR